MLAWHPYALFIVLFLIFGLITALVNQFTVRRFDQYPPAKEFPFVSVLIPARNEAHNFTACVTSLLTQDYPNFEVIVLNDNSTDDTCRILERLAKNDNRLRVIQGAPLPEDWLGKHWACHQLDQAAIGELILFTDADTRHTPDMLRASVSALIAEHADLVTAFPREEVITWGERLLVPFMCWATFTFIPLRLVQKLHWSALSITLGQFMLFRRAAYDAVGGFEAVKSDVVDDVCLGRRIIASGGEWRFMDGTRHVSCRMYGGLRESIGGFSKTLFAVFDYRILPYVFAWTLAGLAILGPVIEFILHWVPRHLPSMPVEYTVISMVLSMILWLITLWRFRFPRYLVFFYPLSMALFIVVAALSFLQVVSGTATWKDRVLDRSSALRWL